MNSYTVLIDCIHRETVIVTASSPEDAIRKVVDNDYDDIIDSEHLDHWDDSTAVVELLEEDVEWGED